MKAKMMLAVVVVITMLMGGCDAGAALLLTTTNACVVPFLPIPTGLNICNAVCAGQCTFNVGETILTFPGILFRCQCGNGQRPPANLNLQNLVQIACSAVDPARQCTCAAGLTARRCTLSFLGILDPFHVFCTCDNVGARKEIETDNTVAVIETEIETANSTVPAKEEIEMESPAVPSKNEIET